MAIRLTKADCVIYEMPKTGTTFIRKALLHCGIAHTFDEPLIKSCPRHSPWWCYPKATTMVGIVRHPVKWFESWYKFHRYGSETAKGSLRRLNSAVRVELQPDMWYPHRMMWAKDGTFSMPFDIWMETMLMFYPSSYTRLVDAFLGPCGYTAMHHVMQAECLVNDLSRILLSLGYENATPEKLREIEHQNVSNGDVEWTPYLRNQVIYQEQLVIRRYYE